MKRVDFDPDGERNPQNRGKSGYVRISWDEALDIVAKEINRQKRVHGPGSITFPMSSHHQWGNVGYYLSALTRFANLIGFTRVAANPDSWEGWYWGAMHHFGNSMRVGMPAGYGGVEDCLKEAEMIVFWSSDPESTNGAYAGFEGTPRRLWAKELGMRVRAHRPALQSDGAAAGRTLDSRSGRRPTRPWPRRSCMSGSPRGCTTRSTSRPAPPASTNGRPTCWARPTACPRRPNGRRRRPAFPPRTSAPWPACGAARRSIWPSARPAPASAAPAAARRERNGRAA